MPTRYTPWVGEGTQSFEAALRQGSAKRHCTLFCGLQEEGRKRSRKAQDKRHSLSMPPMWKCFRATHPLHFNTAGRQDQSCLHWERATLHTGNNSPLALLQPTREDLQRCRSQRTYPNSLIYFDGLILVLSAGATNWTDTASWPSWAKTGKEER